MTARARVIRWGFRTAGRVNQWHYGAVVSDDGETLRVEYTHSRPVSNQEPGRVVELRRRPGIEIRPVSS